jgi:hypothetical protein
LPFEFNLQRYTAASALGGGGGSDAVGLCTMNQVDP